MSENPDNKTKVKLFYKASIVFEIDGNSRHDMHKKAYNMFMDSPPNKVFSSSEIEYDFIETSIEGENGGDMLHI